MHAHSGGRNSESLVCVRNGTDWQLRATWHCTFQQGSAVPQTETCQLQRSPSNNLDHCPNSTFLHYNQQQQHRLASRPPPPRINLAALYASLPTPEVCSNTHRYHRSSTSPLRHPSTYAPPPLRPQQRHPLDVTQQHRLARNTADQSLLHHHIVVGVLRVSPTARSCTRPLALLQHSPLPASSERALLHRPPSVAALSDTTLRSTPTVAVPVLRCSL